MPEIQRNKDVNIAGGVALGGASSVFVNGENVLIPDTPVSSHECGSISTVSGSESHCSAHTSGGSSTVFAEGQPIIHVDDIDTCGHKRTGGSDNVYVAI